MPNSVLLGRHLITQTPDCLRYHNRILNGNFKETYYLKAMFT